MSEEIKLSKLRNMANMPVEETFQGILRVSNYKEIENNIPDDFLNSEYYGKDESATWNDTEQNTHLAYYGNISRFVKGDNDKYYRNLKLPVTDSRGYFLNLFLGENASTIGINPSIGELNISGEKYFPIIEATTLKVGTLPTDLNDVTSGDNVNLNIISDDYTAKLVINSSSYHNNDALATPGTGETYQTIFIDDEQHAPSIYDAFIYRQEYRDKNSVSGRKHSYVRIQNIKEYIEKRLNSYFDMNTKEVPTGMIIYHYSTLKNWYCPTQSYNDSDDNEYPGYRPGLYKKLSEQSKNNQFLAYNTVQGLSTGDAHLKWENDTLEEIVPEYKRDYALCDGRSYNMQIAPSYSDINKPYTSSFERFYKLFHCIGYYYSNDSTICSRGHYQNVKNGNYYELPSDLLTINHEDIDKKQLYEITMAAANAFIALNYAINTPSIYNSSIKGDDGLYNKAKAQTWLSGKTFNEIPGCICFESSKQTTNYNGVSIGTKISSFTDEINYYYYNNGIKTNILAPILKTAEVQKMLNLFAEGQSGLEQKFGNIFDYSFNVPKLYTAEDPEIVYNFGDKNYGLFIGSNGLMEASEIKDAKNDITYTPLSVPFVQNVTCNFNPGFYPHTHGTTTTTRTFNAYSDVFKAFTNDNSVATTLNDKNYISANYIGTNALDIDAYGTHSYSSEYSQNYFINQVTNSSESNIYNEQICGIPAKEYKSSVSGANWYGRTSGPINITTASGTLNSEKSKWTEEYIFRPENVRMLPLIKL